MIGKLALDLIEHPLSTFLVPVPGGRRLAPQGAWEMLRSPAGLRVTWCQSLEWRYLSVNQKLNENRLLHVTQATFVKLLIINDISTTVYIGYTKQCD